MIKSKTRLRKIERSLEKILVEENLSSVLQVLALMCKKKIDKDIVGIGRDLQKLSNWATWVEAGLEG